jgi:hypothetical protein
MSSLYAIHIARVVVNGVSGPPPAESELRGLIEAALVAAMSNAPLPAGRSRHTVVQVRAPLLHGARGIANAVGSGVVQALKGGPSRG